MATLSRTAIWIARPVLTEIIRGEDTFRTTPLSVKTPVSVPASDIKHGLAPKIDRLEALLNEAPDSPVQLDVWRVGSGPQPVPEIKLVVPGDRIDPRLKLGFIHRYL